ncbi:unnamed protein product, partial [Staurois parvus]
MCLLSHSVLCLLRQLVRYCVVPLMGVREKVDWDRWAENLLALLEGTSVSNSGLDMTSAVLNGGTAEQLIDKGPLAVAADGLPPNMDGPSE